MADPNLLQRERVPINTSQGRRPNQQDSAPIMRAEEQSGHFALQCVSFVLRGISFDAHGVSILLHIIFFVKHRIILSSECFESVFKAFLLLLDVVIVRLPTVAPTGNIFVLTPQLGQLVKAIFFDRLIESGPPFDPASRLPDVVGNPVVSVEFLHGTTLLGGIDYCGFLIERLIGRCFAFSSQAPVSAGRRFVHDIFCLR